MITSVPNVSEGRDRIEAMATACAAARVLDVDPGFDANRTVLTLTGTVASLAEATFSLARWAVEHIDLRRHRGIHVRMGAIDVIPFVPMGGEHDACARLAEVVSRRVADDLGLPVFRYGTGARTLRSVRRGGFEELATTMRELAPDFGPPVPHATAGAVAIGVRPVLVAFNVSLDTTDVALARRVARAVRASSGGLPGVMALGWYCPSYGCAQVSMNLTDWTVTPPHVAFEAVRSQAPVRGSELVGMMPRGALEAAARHWGTDIDGAALRLNLSLHKPFDPARKLIAPAP
jgi:glutamate formiminotransferase